mgnify:CR=1 FL=1
MWCVLAFRSAEDIRAFRMAYGFGREVAYQFAYLPFSTFGGAFLPGQLSAVLQSPQAGVESGPIWAIVSQDDAVSSTVLPLPWGERQPPGGLPFALDLASSYLRCGYLRRLSLYTADRLDWVALKQVLQYLASSERAAFEQDRPVSAARERAGGELEVLYVHGFRPFPEGCLSFPATAAEYPAKGGHILQTDSRLASHSHAALFACTLVVSSPSAPEGELTSAATAAFNRPLDGFFCALGQMLGGVAVRPQGVPDKPGPLVITKKAGTMKGVPDLYGDTGQPAVITSDGHLYSTTSLDATTCGPGSIDVDATRPAVAEEEEYVVGSGAAPAITAPPQCGPLADSSNECTVTHLDTSSDVLPANTALDDHSDRWAWSGGDAVIKEDVKTAAGIVDACLGIIRCNSAELMPHAASVAHLLLSADWDILWQELLGIYQGKDRMQLPTVDYAYQDLPLYDPQTGEPNPAFVEGPTNLATVKLKLPAAHPVGKYADVGLKIVDVQLWALVDVMLLLYLDYRRNKISYDLMSAGDAVRRAVDELWNKVQHFNPQDIYRRAFRHVRWYAERAIMAHTEYVLTREYAPWVSHDEVGQLGCPYDMVNWRWGVNGTYETTASEASLTLHLQNYLDGYFEFSSRLTNTSGLARLRLFVDGVDRSDELVDNLRTYLNMVAGQHTVQFVFEGEPGDKAEVAGFRLDNASFVSATVAERSVAGTGQAAMDTLLSMLLHYFDIHHRRKIKGSRLLWLNANKHDPTLSGRGRK